MHIGYACLAIALEGAKIKTCTLRNASAERLLTLAGDNFAALEQMIDYNITNNIRLYRISSDIVPFGSSHAAELRWDHAYAARLLAIAEKIKTNNMRVSMHPGQYTVLNSPDADVVRRAIEDLAYHARFLDALKLDATHKIILHIGGKYGAPFAALARFAAVYRDLPAAVSRRLVLENDGSIFTVSEVLELCHRIGAPAVYDNLHNAINPADATKSDAYWIDLCRDTWREKDGAQKTHYSQQHPAKTRGAHSDTIAIDPFLDYCHSLAEEKPDIMLEVKDKNRSAVKCVLCTAPPNQRLLETEWGRYKYSVLERAPGDYQTIRTLLKDKQGDHALVFYQTLERALSLPEDKGRALNALEHVWGYFPGHATPAETRRYQTLRDGYLRGSNPLDQAKRLLYRLSQKYRQDYLLGSYYFTL
ncbi:MAG TPA: UV DNA damage repair endonuclease UvsE [Clostridiales bacterium]|nr:UV DNA damage repair endonuclease UvsE [Clostridiales bacterium]